MNSFGNLEIVYWRRINFMIEKNRFLVIWETVFML